MDLKSWIGKTEVAYDSAASTPVAALAATLDLDPQTILGELTLPPLWHWLYFLPLHRRSELTADGHARRGGFLPPIELPRRMWAGSQLHFKVPLRLGDRLKRISTIDGVEEKTGRTGSLVFVKVRHEIYANDSPTSALTDIHDIVYRKEKHAGAFEPPPKRAPESQKWKREWIPDEVLLFRYSALTFNNHRIHYDRSYATEVEGYPGLIVHGPLIATLLLDLLRREMRHACVARFEFRAVRPIFDTQNFSVCGEPSDDGKTIRLWARDEDGYLSMEALAVIN